ncbi:hypothetical protein HGG76_27500 [Ochrobactrum tritici]|uniref:Uncharacterized protein n=1 Tax=Brucella tritici TaxID=94626 RepID=A0A7X6FSV7_9HYPH|nr:hypothetical protein [Brucella tritici]
MNQGPVRKALEASDLYLSLIDGGYGPTGIAEAFASDYADLSSQHSMNTVVNAIGSIRKDRKARGLVAVAKPKSQYSSRKQASIERKPCEIPIDVPEPVVTVDVPVPVQEPVNVIEEPSVETILHSEVVAVDDAAIPGFEIPRVGSRKLKLRRSSTRAS